MLRLMARPLQSCYRRCCHVLPRPLRTLGAGLRFAMTNSSARMKRYIYHGAKRSYGPWKLKTFAIERYFERKRDQIETLPEVGLLLDLLATALSARRPLMQQAIQRNSVRPHAPRHDSKYPSAKATPI